MVVFIRRYKLKRVVRFQRRQRPSRPPCLFPEERESNSSFNRIRSSTASSPRLRCYSESLADPVAWPIHSLFAGCYQKVQDCTLKDCHPLTRERAGGRGEAERKSLGQAEQKRQSERAISACSSVAAAYNPSRLTVCVYVCVC